jgi:hypothetical protein
MTPDEQKRIDDLLALFVTPGWRELMAELTEIEQQLDSITGVNTVEVLWKNKGKLEVLSMLLGYEAAIKRAIDEESDEKAAGL